MKSTITRQIGGEGVGDQRPESTFLASRPVPHRRYRRTGKIARLPEATREQINRMIEDGVLYRDIITALVQTASPPLPYPISESNISQWRKTGYQDWRLRRQQLQVVRQLALSVRDTIQRLVDMRARRLAQCPSDTPPPAASEPIRT